MTTERNRRVDQALSSEVSRRRGAVSAGSRQAQARSTAQASPSRASAGCGVRAHDSFTLAVAHDEDDVAVLDCLVEIRSPFNPTTAVADRGDSDARPRRSPARIAHTVSRLAVCGREIGRLNATVALRRGHIPFVLAGAAPAIAALFQDGVLWDSFSEVVSGCPRRQRPNESDEKSSGRGTSSLGPSFQRGPRPPPAEAIRWVSALTTPPSQIGQPAH
jgi:hypothetical protein